MKLTSYKSYHTDIGGDYESIESVWNLAIEDTDTYDAKIKERFKTIQIIQRTYLENVKRDTFTWYQGYRTNCFGSDTKDKQKKFVIEEANKFMHTFKNHALVAQWSEQSAHN